MDSPMVSIIWWQQLSSARMAVKKQNVLGARRIPLLKRTGQAY
jgi:hypothetical protein